MSVASVIGRLGEHVAADYLTKGNYEVRERNFRASRGEIDIIAAKGDELIFIEVKTWRGLEKASLEQALSRRKIGRIVSAAKAYLAAIESGETFHARFDVILVDPDTRRVDHIEHAFTENDC